MLKTNALLASCLVLAACGGSGGSTGVSNTPTGPAEMLERIDEAGDLNSFLQLRSGAADTVDPGGTASFNGVMNLVENATSLGDTFYGDASITVDFAGDSASGTVGDFYYYDSTGNNGRTGAAVNGTLNVSASSLMFDDPSTVAVEGFATSITGDLDIDRDGTADAVSASAFESSFAGIDLDATGGADDIDMMVGNGTVTFGGTTLEAQLWACTNGVRSTCP